MLECEPLGLLCACDGAEYDFGTDCIGWSVVLYILLEFDASRLQCFGFDPFLFQCVLFLFLIHEILNRVLKISLSVFITLNSSVIHPFEGQFWSS